MALVMAMYADYQAGMSACAVARKHGRKSHQNVRDIFQRRGLSIRPPGPSARWQLGNPGKFTRQRRKTAAEIQAIQARMTSLHTPRELAFEWREWPMARRRRFIAEVRARLNLPGGRPAGPFSANVTPFEYGTPAAHAIVDAFNAGRSSRCKKRQIRLASQGVIWNGELYFWVPFTNGGAYMQAGSWTPERGRLALHRIVWERTHGPLPPKSIVYFKDGNKNNFDPANLAVMPMRENALRNSITARLKRDPENPALQRITARRIARGLQTRLANSARRAAALLNLSLDKNNPVLLPELKAYEPERTA